MNHCFGMTLYQIINTASFRVQFIPHAWSFCLFESFSLKMPRVRIELTTFRLWDWRAAYCANEASMQIKSANERLAPVAQSVSASYLYVSNDKEMRRSGVRASPGASIIWERWRVLYLACFDFFPSVLAKNEMASVGVEPTTFALLARRSNRLS